MIRHSRNGLRAGKVSMAGFSVFLMKTACSTEKLEFHGFGRRAVMGHFDGGMISPDFSPGDAMTNRQDRRFARRKPPVGLRPGKGAMNASSAVCKDDLVKIVP